MRTASSQNTVGNTEVLPNQQLHNNLT